MAFNDVYDDACDDVISMMT